MTDRKTDKGRERKVREKLIKKKKKDRACTITSSIR